MGDSIGVQEAWAVYVVAQPGNREESSPILYGDGSVQNR